MRFRPIIAVLILSITAITSSVNAVDIAVYNFTDSSLAASTADPNVTAGNVNFTGSSATQFTLANVLAINAATGANNAATAVSNNSYYQFEVTPVAGATMNLSSLNFQGASATSAPSNGYVIRSSTDSYTTNLQTAGFTTQYATFANYSVSLTGSEFQNLTTGISFRIYTYMNAGSNPAAGYDNLTLTGTVVTVPEPSTYALAAIAAGTIGYSARRRRNVATRA